MAELSDELVRRLTPVREVIHRARSTVFPVVGSGLSLGPPGKGLLGWRAFLERIIDDAREEDRAELRALLERGKYIEVASLLEHDLRAGSLAQYVQREFQRPRIPAPEVYQLVAKLPTDHFATTNYDPWLKNAVSQREHAAPRVYVPTDQGAFSDIAPGSPPLVLMLHGDADRPESCVLSQRAYRKTQYHPPFRRGMEALAAQRTFLFIGHSVTDPDLIAVLEEWAEIFSAGAHGAPRHVMLGAGIDRATALRLRELAVDPIEYGKSGDHSALPAVLRFLATPPGAPDAGGVGGSGGVVASGSTTSDGTRSGKSPGAATGPSASSSTSPAEAAPALAAPESRPLRPRLLLAGPWFGVRKELQKELAALAASAPENLLEAVRGKLESDGAVARAQLAAILRYDFIIDLSPWRAFERWMSVGFRDVEQALRPGFSAMPPDALAVFAFGEDGAPAAELAALLSGATLPSKLSKDLAAAITARLEHLQSELPALGDRLLAAAGEGVALAGSSEDHHALVRPWVTRVAAAAGGLCSTLTPPRWLSGLGLRHQSAPAALDGELTSPTIADYLRALRVVAGQVRLLGELRYRPLEDVFVELELHRDREESARTRAADTKADRPKETAAELEREREADLQRLRDEEDTPRDAMAPERKLTAEQLLTVAPRLYLEGLAGTGKSTSLRWLAVLASRRTETGGPLPVWVELAALQNRSSLAEALAESALATLRLPTATGAASEELGARLRTGDALLLLDGLDENERATDMLAARLTELAEGCRLVLSARPLGALTLQLALLPRVRLHGLELGGALRFLRAYFGETVWQAPLLEGLEALPDGEQWQRTPVLLALAATHVAAGRALPEHTLDLYDQTLDRLLALGAVRASAAAPGAATSRELLEAVRGRLRSAACSALLPEQGEPTTAIARGELGTGTERNVAVQSGVFSGGDVLRFAHLTLGEYLAAEARIQGASSLAWLAAARQRPELRTGKREALAIAHALAQEGALLAALEEAERDTEADPEHACLGLVLRALAYGGDQVQRFVARHGARVIAAVAAVFQLASGRFGEAERRIGALAERAVRGAQRWWPAKAWHPLAAWKGCAGELGLEAHVLAWWLGANWSMPTALLSSATAAHATRVWAALNKRDAGLPIAERLGAIRREIAMSDVRASAARALVKHPNALALFASAVHDSNERVRAVAVTALTNHPSAIALLTPFLRDPDERVRAAAVTALTNHPSAIALLFPLLQDSSGTVHTAAIKALAKCPDVPSLLRDPSPYVRAGAAEALAKHTNAIELLSPLLEDPDAHVRAVAVAALASHPIAHELLTPLLHDPEARVRHAAVSALAKHPHALSLLTPLLQDPQRWIRAEVIGRLADHPNVNALLIPFLNDRDARARAAAVSALSSDTNALSILSPLLQDPDWYVRSNTVYALASHVDAPPLLAPLAQDPEPAVRGAAVGALAKHHSARSLLIPLLHAIESDVRAKAVTALANDPNASDLLAPLLHDSEPDVRARAIKALAHHPDAHDILAPLLQDSKSEVRFAAVQALGKHSNDYSLFLPFLRSPDAFVRNQAIRELTEHPNAFDILPRILALPEMDVTIASVQALAYHPDALQYLPPLLQDEDDDVRAAASFALSRFPNERDLLIPLLQDPNDGARAFTLRVIVDHPRVSELVPPLLQDSSNRVRATAAYVIARRLPNKIDLVLPLSQDPDSLVRATVAIVVAYHPNALALLTPLLQDPASSVRAAAATALAKHPDASTLLPPLLQDPDDDVRVAAATALANHPSALPLLAPLLHDVNTVSGVRVAAVAALADHPDTSTRLPPLLQDPNEAVRAAARAALHAMRSPAAASGAPVGSAEVLDSSLAAWFGETSPWDRTLAGEELPRFVRSPWPIYLSNSPALGQLALRWLLRRLTKTDSLRDIGDSKAASGPEVDDSTWQCFGHLYQEQLPEVGRVLWVHVQMGEYELAFWRDVPIAANVLRAYELARFVTTSDPTYVLLACVDVDPEHVRANIPSLIEQLKTSPIANLQQPPLLVRGPFYAFALPHGEAPKELSATELLFTADLGRRWPTLSHGEQEAALDLLYRLARSAAVEPLMLISPLAALAEHLPPALARTLRERLPAGSARAAALLEAARAGVAPTLSLVVSVATETLALPPTPATRAHELADALLGKLPPDTPALTAEQVADQLDQLAAELPTLDGEDLLRLLGALDAFWSAARGAARTLLAKRVLAALENLPFAEAPVQRRLSELLSPLRRYLHQQG